MAKKIKLPSGWRYEPVTPRMRSPCSACESPIQDVRLTLVIDSYPFPTSSKFCKDCGIEKMRQQLKENADKIDAFEKFCEVGA